MKPVKKKHIPKPTHFGKNLKLLRRMKGVSQTSIAKATGMTRNNIASYESGVVEPNVKNFFKVCKYFSVDPKKMLEADLTEHPTEITNVDPTSDNVVNDYLTDHLDQFVIQTNEMTKVLEGYQAFYDLQRESIEDKSSRELYSTMDDLLSLLQSLIKANWHLIQKFYPEEEE